MLVISKKIYLCLLCTVFVGDAFATNNKGCLATPLSGPDHDCGAACNKATGAPYKHADCYGPVGGACEKKGNKDNYRYTCCCWN